MMFAATGDAAFRQRVDYIVDELSACQRARGDGLVCGFPDGAAPLENSLAGRPFAGVPWYTMHKVFAGLRDARVHTGSAQALTVLSKLCDWTVNATRDVPDDRLQKMLDREHGGMSEVLADCSVLTGNDTYLRLAERFVHRAVISPWVAGHDTLDGLHSNTQIPKVIGIARLHQLRANPDYARGAEFFWHTVVERRSYATGGNGDKEHFFPPADFAKHLTSAKTMETCCAHNMLRLTRQLFLNAPSAALADYYERALINSILASQDPQSGMMTYFQATRPGYVKLYCTPTDSFWCCTGSGMENHAKYGDSIYFHDDDSLYVNLFIASELDWAAKGLRVRQSTNFPQEETTQLSVHTSSPSRMRLKVRHPAWCARMSIAVNGKPHALASTPGSYAEIDRTWRDGDVVNVRLPMQLRFEPLPNAPQLAAVMYGPLTLAGRFGTAGITPGSDIIVNERTSGEMLDRPMDVPRLALKDVRRTGSGELAFTARDIELVPWYRIAHERFSLYWNINA